MPTIEVVGGRRQASGLLHPLRRRILEALAAPDSASGLARRLGLPRQRLNYHLRSLERSGFVELVEERRRGNCNERLLRATARAFVIDPALLAGLDTGATDPGDRFSSSSLVAAAARAIRDIGALRRLAEKEGARPATFTLQGEVRIVSAQKRKAFMEDLTRAVAGLTAKYHDEHSPDGSRYTWFLAGYPSVAAEGGPEASAGAPGAPGPPDPPDPHDEGPR